MPVARQIEKIIFEAARELGDPALRSAFLDQACTGQPALRQRLERLLAVQAPADVFFRATPLREAGVDAGAERVAVAPAVPATLANQHSETANTMIGRYRLLQRLGEGGCGVVYLAEQQEPVRRRLALKIIRLGMDTESVIARFKVEQQALALMEHPNIAHVLDAGATESGRPYFVMELVEGVKITDYCNQHTLDIPRRLKLFIQVCQAIQHAHLKGVIHRDIKPSNILVTLHDGEPVPKVIDFGIAKATQGQLSDSTRHTYTARDQFIGTPAYMSPEQAGLSGLDVDTRSDIYSLGVLLYELLTGQTPFDSKELTQRGLDELRRTLHEQEPPPPSARLTNLGDTRLTEVAAQHSAEPPRLLSTLRGDLDWIVMKALEKDRARRYETANGLAMDVQRYLNNEPVVARPPSRLYRFQKLVRRNRVVFAAITAVTAALLSGLGSSTWMFLQERDAHRRAEAAEQQQIRLREESDHLRRQAEYRQKLTAATFARSRDRIEEADLLVAGIPAPEPNLEYAELYRTLGDWHAANGRWKQAMDRYGVLLQVNQPDDWDVTTLDDLRYGPLLVESGDRAGYERFCRQVVAHFADSTNPVAAERVVKVTLLTPASADFLAALEPLARTASNSLVAPPQNNLQRSLGAWRAFSLALMAYRQGNYTGVNQWYEKSISYDGGSTARAVTFQILLAMTHCQTGKRDLARAELAQARRNMADKFNSSPASDYWFDWVFARILLREADGLLAPAKS